MKLSNLLSRDLTPSMPKIDTTSNKSVKHHLTLCQILGTMVLFEQPKKALRTNLGYAMLRNDCHKRGVGVTVVRYFQSKQYIVTTKHNTAQLRALYISGIRTDSVLIYVT